MSEALSETTLNALLAMAESQQKATIAAIEGLQSERQALTLERAMLQRTMADLIEQVKQVNPVVQKSAQEGARTGAGHAVAQSMAGMPQLAAAAFVESSKPVLARLEGSLSAAAEASASLSRASKWFAWKAAAVIAVAVFASVGLAAFVAVELSPIQEMHALRAELSALTAKLAQQETKGGARSKAERSGEAKR